MMVITQHFVGLEILKTGTSLMITKLLIPMLIMLYQKPPTFFFMKLVNYASYTTTRLRAWHLRTPFRFELLTKYFFELLVAVADDIELINIVCTLLSGSGYFCLQMRLVIYKTSMCIGI